MERKKWILAAICGLMVLSALVSAINRQRNTAPFYDAREDVSVSSLAPRQRPVSEHNAAREFSNAIADAVEKVMPSVVVIRTEKIKQTRQRVALDPFGFTQGVRIIPEQLQGQGSGVIIDELGHVITSYHVIEGAVGGEVVLNDGTKMGATIVGFDKASDLAVLRIDKAGPSCPAVEFGDSDGVRVGEVSIAIGSPFSLQSSVTVGHISQKGRRVQILPYEDFIQTDAAINEGNSGGPLIDVDGRLIGINAAIQTEAQKRGVGIAFAVPSNLALVIANSIIETGKHEWPWVGAFFYTVAASERDTFDGAGVLVSQVWNNTPAARAGLQPGDRIMEVDGVTVLSKFDVDRMIYNHGVGETVEFLVEQGDNKSMTIELVLEEFPTQTP